MINAFRQSKFWIAANIVGMGVYFYMACQTWNIDSALGSPFPLIQLCQALWLLLYVAVNLTWFIFVTVGICRWRAWRPLIIWISGIALWVCAVQYDRHRFSIEVEEAAKL